MNPAGKAPRPAVTGTKAPASPVPVRPAARRHPNPSRGETAARPGVTPAILALAKTMSETELQTLITTGPSRREPGLCRQLNLRFYHTHDSRRSPSGFPDLVIVGPAGGVFWELKREGQTISPAQRSWLASLTAAGFTTAIVYPVDYLTGVCARELAALTGRVAS